MAQVIKQVGDELIAVTDLKQPSGVEPSQLQRQVILIDNFLDAEQKNPIRFVLDERFRESAIQELIERGKGVDPSTAKTKRDLANFIEVDKQTTTEESERVPIYVSILMQHDVYIPQSVNNIIDAEFTEFA